MRDEMTFAERLHNELRDVRWPEPAELREQARRRRRRAVLGAAGAVLVLAAGPAYAVMSRTPSPSAPQPAAPQSQLSPSVLPSQVSPSAGIVYEALVQPEDLAVKTDPPLSRTGLVEPVRIDPMLLFCLQAQGRHDYWRTSRYSRSQTLLRASASDEPRPADVVLNQEVYRLAPEVAAGFFTRLDEMLAPCAHWRSEGEAQWDDRIVRAEVDHRWEVADRNFAGDEAMLIRHTVGGARNLETGETRRTGQPEIRAVVRVGDLVTVLALGRDGTETELRRVATVAAQRLCAATHAVC